MIKKILDKYFIKKPKFRELVTKIIYGSSNTDINIFGNRLTINKLRENGYFRASKKIKNSSLLEDEVPVIMTLLSQMENDGCFVDVGANIGLFSSIFAQKAKIFKNFQVFAFEVNPETFKRTKANANKNGFKAFNIGISKTEKKLKFVEGAVSHVTTIEEKINKYSIKEKNFIALCKPLDNILSNKKNILLKIDVEGQEREVLQGAKHLIRRGAIKAIYIDGYDDPSVWEALEKEFLLLDGRTLEVANRATHSLLALKRLGNKSLAKSFDILKKEK